MNDRRFKELVNLHLDHRLSSGEAEELEHALREDPARRRMLDAYAAMQHGCSIVCRRSAAGAPASASLLRAIRNAERKVQAPAVNRPVWRDWAGWGVAGGLAAAVFALIAVRVSSPDGEFTVAVTERSQGIVQIATTSPDQTRNVASSASAPQSFAAEVSRQMTLPSHLTLAALGIAGETNREVGVISRWSYPLDDLTEQEVQRAAAWARHANTNDWGSTGGAQLGSRFSSAGPTDGFQAGQVSFTTNR